MKKLHRYNKSMVTHFNKKLARKTSNWLALIRNTSVQKFKAVLIVSGGLALYRLLVMGIQVMTWLAIGLLQFKGRAGMNPQLKTHHFTKRYSFLPPLQTDKMVHMSGTVDRW